MALTRIPAGPQLDGETAGESVDRPLGGQIADDGGRGRPATWTELDVHHRGTGVPQRARSAGSRARTISNVARTLISMTSSPVGAVEVRNGRRCVRCRRLFTSAPMAGWSRHQPPAKRPPTRHDRPDRRPRPSASPATGTESPRTTATSRSCLVASSDTPKSVGGEAARYGGADAATGPPWTTAPTLSVLHCTPPRSGVSPTGASVPAPRETAFTPARHPPAPHPPAPRSPEAEVRWSG